MVADTYLTANHGGRHFSCHKKAYSGSEMSVQTTSNSERIVLLQFENLS